MPSSLFPTSLFLPFPCTPITFNAVESSDGRVLSEPSFAVLPLSPSLVCRPLRALSGPELSGLALSALIVSTIGDGGLIKLAPRDRLWEAADAAVDSDAAGLAGEFGTLSAVRREAGGKVLSANCGLLGREAVCEEGMRVVAE